MATPSEGDQFLPTYTESATEDDAAPSSINASSSSSSTPTSPLALPTNFLTIVRENDINGRYTIDPSMPAPPGAVSSVGDDGKPLNMCITSTYGSTNIVVELVHRGIAIDPALLAVDSQYGSVTVAVHDRRPNRFRLKATSKHGDVIVRLPSTFVGAVSTKFGELRSSSAVQAHLVTFSEQDHEGRFFIGNYASSGYEDDVSWSGDHLRVEAEHGRVGIEFVDEGSGKK